MMSKFQNFHLDPTLGRPDVNLFSFVIIVLVVDVPLLWIISITAEGVGVYFAILAHSKEWFCVGRVIHPCVFVNLVKS